MKVLRNLAVVVVYIVMWFVTWGGALQHFYMLYPAVNSKHECRGERAFSMGIAAVPVVPWVVIPFLTGFYQDGFKWSCSDAPDRNQYGGR